MRSERHWEEASIHSEKNELKQVFSRLQHKSKAQNVEQCSNGDEAENTTCSNLNSMCAKFCRAILCYNICKYYIIIINKSIITRIILMFNK